MRKFDLKFLVISIFLVSFLFSLVGLTIYILRNKNLKGIDGNSLGNGAAFENENYDDAILVQGDKSIVYIREDLDNELWIADWNGENAWGLGIKKVIAAQNGFNRDSIVYKLSIEKDQLIERLYLFDLKTKKSVEFPYYEDDQLISGHAEFVVSPDGNYVIYELEYRNKNCKFITEGQETGWECGEPFDEKDIPEGAPLAGDYAYDVKTHESKYISSSGLLDLTFYNWNKSSSLFYSSYYYCKVKQCDSMKVYEFDIAGMFESDLSESTIVSEKHSNDETKYILQGLIFRFHEITESDSEDTDFSLTVQKEGGEDVKQLDTGFLQHWMWISPNQKYALYKKSDDVSELRMNDLYAIDLETLGVRLVYKSTVDKEAKSVQWVNDGNFVVETDAGFILVNMDTLEPKDVIVSKNVSLEETYSI
ncbi:MAG: hypothetical protein PHS44_07125 [Candidatus Dojkabacteria bacterium]|nr:hypothetical protein [Candidatus Dojkabacteria bacterium]